MGSSHRTAARLAAVSAGLLAAALAAAPARTSPGWADAAPANPVVPQGPRAGSPGLASVAAALAMPNPLARPLDLRTAAAIKPDPFRFLVLPGGRRGELREPRLVSAMPIVVPQAGLDRYMPVKRPDSAIEYRMLIVRPAIRSAN
jgi:hypothetical protein